jgi:GGDEF domain-containing protein
VCKRALQSSRRWIDKLQQSLIEAEILRRELREQAIRDPLTGLFNRRFMEESMNQEVAASASWEYESRRHHVRHRQIQTTE